MMIVSLFCVGHRYIELFLRSQPGMEDVSSSRGWGGSGGGGGGGNFGGGNSGGKCHEHFEWKKDCRSYLRNLGSCKKKVRLSFRNCFICLN